MIHPETARPRRAHPNARNLHRSCPCGLPYTSRFEWVCSDGRIFLTVYRCDDCGDRHETYARRRTLVRPGLIVSRTPCVAPALVV
jgi:hypothetical protein